SGAASDRVRLALSGSMNENDSRLRADPGRGLPGSDLGEGAPGDPLGFPGGDAETAQEAFGELVDRGLVALLGVVLVHAQQPEQAAGHGAQGDVGVGHGEASGGVAHLDVAQRAGCQAAGPVQELEAGSGDEAGQVGVGPAEPAGDAEGRCEHLGGGVEAGAGAVDHLAPALQDLLRGGPEQFLLAFEVVVEGPEADVGRFGYLLDGGALAAYACYADT